LKDLESFGIAEEARDADQDIGVQRIELFRVAPQETRILGQRRLAVDDEAPVNASPDRRILVQREIDSRVIVEQQEDLFVTVVFAGVGARNWRALARCELSLRTAPRRQWRSIVLVSDGRCAVFFARARCAI